MSPRARSHGRPRLGSRAQRFREPEQTMTNKDQIRASELRKRAEADLALGPNPGASIPAELKQRDLHAVLHEMQVHQVELELQNEELRDAHLEIDALHARYLDLYERAPVGYCRVSADGSILNANLALARLLGMDRDELIGRPFIGVILRSDVERYRLLRQDLVARSAPTDCELQMVRWDGSQLWVVLTASLSAPIGAGAELLVTIADISASKAATKALQASEARSRAITESAHDAIVVAGGDGAIVDWNHGAQVMFGHTAAEAIGEHVTLLMPERYRQAHSERMASASKWPISVAGKLRELHGLRKNGQEFAVEISLADWQQGDERFFSAFIRDISERIQARQVLATHYATLSRFNELAVGRELRMVQLKSEINTLCARLGEPPMHQVG